jgi:hypothetical protein
MLLSKAADYASLLVIESTKDNFPWEFIYLPDRMKLLGEVYTVVRIPIIRRGCVRLPVHSYGKGSGTTKVFFQSALKLLDKYKLREIDTYKINEIDSHKIMVELSEDPLREDIEASLKLNDFVIVIAHGSPASLELKSKQRKPADQLKPASFEQMRSEGPTVLLLTACEAGAPKWNNWEWKEVTTQSFGHGFTYGAKRAMVCSLTKMPLHVIKDLVVSLRKSLFQDKSSIGDAVASAKDNCRGHCWSMLGITLYGSIYQDTMSTLSTETDVAVDKL